MSVIKLGPHTNIQRPRFFHQKIFTPLPFVSVGQSATIAAETTAEARTISAVRIFQNNVFVGYGDYNANTGSTPTFSGTNLIYWDGNAFQNAVTAVATEQFLNLRVIDNKLWAIGMDPTAGSDPDYVVVESNMTATVVSKGSLNIEHGNDIFKSSAGDYYFVGSDSTDTDPSVWRSTDSGGTWTRVLSEVVGAVPHRYYTIGEVGGFLWVQRSAASANAFKSADGISWSNAGHRMSSLGSAWPHRAVPFLDRLAFVETSSVLPIMVGYVAHFGGTGAGTTFSIPQNSNSIYDLAVSGDFLYALTSNATQGSGLWRTSNLLSWVKVAFLASNTLRSLDVQNGTAWAGGTDSRLYTVTGL